MQFFTRRRAPVLLATAAFFVLATAFLLGACSGGQNSSESTMLPTSTSALVTSSTDSVTSSTSASAGSTAQSAEITTAPSAASTSSSSAVASTSGQTTMSSVKPTTTATSATTTTAKPTTTTSKGLVALKLSGPSGTKQLSLADLRAMSATSGYGGWKNDLSNITGPVSWTGVSLKSLTELVGGGGSVTVVASDGYSQMLSSGQAAGQVTMFDPGSGETVSSINGSLRVIVAYAKDGAALSSSEGPLRLAFVSSAKDQVTPSKLWVRMVVELKVQ